MAKKVRTFPNIEQVKTVNDNATVSTLMSNNDKQAIVEHQNGVVEMMTIETAKRRLLQKGDIVLSNVTNICKGSTQEHYLIKDMQNYQKGHLQLFENWMQYKYHFHYKENDDSIVDYIVFEDFPLPEFYFENGKKHNYRTDGEFMIIITIGYPEVGPWGVYIRNNSQNKDLFMKALAGKFVMPDTVSHPTAYVDELKQRGFDWICFHYNDPKGFWAFNRNDITRGDCLAKYLKSLYAALNGAFQNA